MGTRLNCIYSCIIDFQIQTFVTITNNCVCACVGRTQLTDAEPAKEIPLGWYDCGDGLYNPQNRVVYTYEMQFLRNAGRNQLRDISLVDISLVDMAQLPL